MKEINSFKKGFICGVPICIGYFSVSFAFGIFSVQSGLSVIETFIISLANLTSAGQLAGVPIIVGGGTYLELMLTQLIINSRYALMSVSLSQKLGKSITTLDRCFISFFNTDISPSNFTISSFEDEIRCLIFSICEVINVMLYSHIV